MDGAAAAPRKDYAGEATRRQSQSTTHGVFVIGGRPPSPIAVAKPRTAPMLGAKEIVQNAAQVAVHLTTVTALIHNAWRRNIKCTVMRRPSSCGSRYALVDLRLRTVLVLRAGFER
jgi:hypothetical protein